MEVTMRARQNSRRVKWIYRNLKIPGTGGRFLTEGLTDPRKRRSKRMVWQVVAFVIVCLMAGKRSLREFEDASVTFSGLVRGIFGIYDKISDNAIGWLISKLDPKEVREMLWTQVEAMIERKQLGMKPGYGIKSLALDGKMSAKGSRKMSEHAQKIESESGAYWKLHVLRAVLTWSIQNVVLWQHPVGIKKNEISGAKRMIKEMIEKDPRKKMFELITFDAMFMVYSLTKMISDAGRHWLAPIKENQPDMYRDAMIYAEKITKNRKPDYINTIEHDGHVYKQYKIWLCPEFAGWETSSHTWSHLKQLWIVELVHFARKKDPETGKPMGRGMDAKQHKVSKSVRLYATDLPIERLSARQSLEVVRSHWSIEDDCFNSLDLQFDEDKHKYFTRGEGTLNMAVLMLMAYNMVQLWRHRKFQIKWDGNKIWMSWKKAFQDFFIAFTMRYPSKMLSKADLSKL